MGVNKNNAGYYLIKKIPVFLESDSVSKIIKSFEENIRNFDNLDYIYVVNKKGFFKGFLPFKNIYSLPKNKPISSFYKTYLTICVKDTDKKEYAAHLSLKNDASCIPVIDANKKLLGIIEDTDILRILHKRNVEERFSLSGISKSHAEVDSILNISIFKSIKHRAIWLILGLLGGLFAAEIIGFFESTLQEHILLAAFIPLVVYIASAVGTQLSAFAIRDFSLFKKIEFSKYLSKQLLSVFIIAIILGIVAAGISFWMYKSQEVSFIIGISIIITTLSSIITGLLIPFVFRKFRSDPANGSGPIGTILQDLLSIVIYFTIVGILL